MLVRGIVDLESYEGEAYYQMKLGYTALGSHAVDAYTFTGIKALLNITTRFVSSCPLQPGTGGDSSSTSQSTDSDNVSP